jgi:hypothetical protein
MSNRFALGPHFYSFTLFYALMENLVNGLAFKKNLRETVRDGRS